MDLVKPYQQKFIDHKICVIIPTYNNATTLKKVIDDVLEYTDNVIVVNDGSTDGTSDILALYKDIKQVNYRNNVGKGWALRKGFEFAIEQGFDQAITIDSDGQHFAKDLPQFIEKLENIGTSLIIGARNMDQDSVPGKSSFGNKFSNFWFWVETGIKAPDTQSGYRLYPLTQLKEIKFFSRKFEFEIEVIVRAAWKGIKIESVPVQVYYAPDGERVSHFRPFTDFSKISVLNTILVIITFVYINPRNFFFGIFKRSTYSSLKNQIFNPYESNLLTASSVAFGVFMGIVPIWGFQLVIAIFLAILLRLNKALVIISANISIPPMIPVIVFLSYKMGHIWVGESFTSLIFTEKITLETIHLNFMQYVYGSITLAVMAAVFFGSIVYVLLTFFKKKKIRIDNE
ncbi:MAG: DUF2062 domain-containing protein [Bacteroidetes bacterium]|nr:DUF2062 domain-containing protein [Bacteroidota bacterium]HET6244630.1 DUF2062 domain-containing protein [Bacteroidia bacterium]